MTKEEAKELDEELAERIRKDKEKNKQIEKLEGQVTRAFEVLEGKRKQIEELKEINEGYNRNRDKLIAMGFPTFKSCKEYSDKLTNLQKENAELKAQIEKMKNDVVRCFGDEYNVLVAKLLEEWKLKE